MRDGPAPAIRWVEYRHSVEYGAPTAPDVDDRSVDLPTRGPVGALALWRGGNCERACPTCSFPTIRGVEQRIGEGCPSARYTG